MKFKKLLLVGIATVATVTTSQFVHADEQPQLPGLNYLEEISKLTIEEPKTKAENRVTFDKVKYILEEEKERIQREAEAKEKAEQEAAAKAAAEAKAAQEAAEAQAAAQAAAQANAIQFGSDGLLVMAPSDRAQNVINLLLGIPGHANGAGYHISTGLDTYIDELTTSEAIWVLYRIEGPGFGQTGAGYAGYDTPESHQAVVRQQINGRFGGSIHSLLKAWGTFSYGGY